jgi:copper chaperone NosL
MKRLVLLVVIILLMALPAMAVEKAPPAPPASAKCPVCGMFVAKYPDWTGVVVFKDAARVYFDGPKDLAAYCLDPGKYDPARKRSDIAAVYVKDYYSLAAIDGRRAFYVIGSDVFGPMGKELVPFSRKVDADGFLHDHRGKRVLGFGEITPGVLKSLE